MIFSYFWTVRARATAVWSLGLLSLLVSQPVWAAFITPTRSSQGMVASAHPLASQAGLEVLKQGGNAADAAVATAFALSVVEPYSAGLGGGGFLLVRWQKTGQTKALDFRERAPLGATRNLYLDPAGKVIPGASLDGHLAVGVPGTVAGLSELHRQSGKLSWAEVIAPAIRYAEQGFVVSDRLTAVITARKALLKNPAARQIFTQNGTSYSAGALLVQTDLAKTLKQIAQDPQSFYTGPIAEAIARDMAQNNGIVSLEDLRRYRPIWRQPLCGPFRQAQVCSMPPPSSGGVHLLQILNLIGDADLKSMGWHSPDALQLMASAMQIAYADRAIYLGDPAFVKVPVAALISPAYAQLRRPEINLQRARPSSQVKAADPALLQKLQRSESPDTTHLTVVDPERNVVSLTFTINGPFGAAVVAAGTGILLNNEMDDFAIAPDTPNLYGLVGQDANAIAPGKTPLSSMTPFIVNEQGKFRLAGGSPGGSTIITTSLQLILNVLVYDMDAGAAISAPRIHHQWVPDQLRLERWGFDPMTINELKRRGNPIEEQADWGNASLIVRTPDGKLEGAADPRGEGAAVGF
jgi:gamma-glutamyltranspeptidase / glutathione hydrolase